MLKKGVYFLKYLFRFRTPEIIELNYVDYVITNKTYFLISWRCRFAYKLSIRPKYSSYFKDSGSAYMLIPSDAASLEVSFSNVWMSQSITVHLRKIKVEPDFEFNLKPDFREWRSAVNRLPRAKPARKRLAVQKTEATITIPTISLQNLTFLNPSKNGK